MSDKSIQDQIGMAESFEEALRLITENPPKPEAKYNRQPVNMSLIVVDPDRLQSRVETSEEVVQQYMMEAQSGDQFPPMVVFFDTEKQKVWLADGFHRHEMYNRLGYRWADCDVRFGSMQDAIAFAATANTKHGLRITPKDRKKSAEMLFGIPRFWESSASVIAKEVGVANGTISEWRLAYALANKMEVPKMLSAADGSKTRSTKVFSVVTLDDAIQKISEGGPRQGYRLEFRGTPVQLGRDYEEAKRKVEKLYKQGFFTEKRGKSTPNTLLRACTARLHLMKHNIHVLPIPSGRPGFPGGVASRAMFYDLAFDGGVIRLAPDLTQENFSCYFGDIVLGGPTPDCRRVVLCYPSREVEPMIKLASHHGVEFISIEDFIDSMPKDQSQSA